jgi:hypothetical protein
MGTFPVDDIEFPVHRRARLIRLIALTEAIVRAGGRTRAQFTLSARTQLQQLAAEVFHLQKGS